MREEHSTTPCQAQLPNSPRILKVEQDRCCVAGGNYGLCNKLKIMLEISKILPHSFSYFLCLQVAMLLLTQIQPSTVSLTLGLLLQFCC